MNFIIHDEVILSSRILSRHYHCAMYAMPILQKFRNSFELTCLRLLKLLRTFWCVNYSGIGWFNRWWQTHSTTQQLMKLVRGKMLLSTIFRKKASYTIPQVHLMDISYLCVYSSVEPVFFRKFNLVFADEISKTLRIAGALLSPFQLEKYLL